MMINSDNYSITSHWKQQAKLAACPHWNLVNISNHLYKDYSPHIKRKSVIKIIACKMYYFAWSQIEDLLERLVLNLTHEMVPHVHTNVSLEATHHAPIENLVLANLRWRQSYCQLHWFHLPLQLRRLLIWVITNIFTATVNISAISRPINGDGLCWDVVKGLFHFVFQDFVLDEQKTFLFPGMF